ncbi:MAG: FecR domain-containing protein [Lentisphaerae bacterium]|nr:FecR domain-containing protein [Lentisphaerota bacterium]
MMTRIVAILVAATFSIHAYGAETEAVGRVIALDGSALARNEIGVDRALAIKSSVFMNDRISTDDESKIQIMFNDDSIISQGANSQMTIDEYVYAQKDRDRSSGSFGFSRGVFRVITGKITELNPERFKVKTRLATIGIRGCELGFRVEMEQEDVYVFELPDGHEILIQRGNTDDEGLHKGWVQGPHKDWVKKGDLLRVLRQGIKISIRDDKDMEGREISLEDARQLIEDATPEVPSEDEEDGEIGGEDDGADDDGGEDVAEDDGGGEVGEDNGEEEGLPDDGDEPVDDEPLFEEEILIDELVDSEDPNSSLFDEDRLEQEALARQAHAVLVAQALESLDLELLRSLRDHPLTTQDQRQMIDDLIMMILEHSNIVLLAIQSGNLDLMLSLLNDRLTTPEQRAMLLAAIDAHETIVPPVEIASGSGNNWRWGIWDSGLVDIDGAFISAPDFNTIASGANLYNLSGSGTAGALIQHAGTKKLVEGSSSLNVQVGMGTVPNWSGAFGMSNTDGDSLNFEADGTIGTTVLPDGRAVNGMTGHRRSYSLLVNGASFDGSSITLHGIKGHLVGPGGGAIPITGAVGKFRFQHGTTAVVDGAFGANLN